MQMLEVPSAQVDTRKEAASHSNHDLAARFGRNGDKDYHDIDFQFTGIVIQSLNIHWIFFWLHGDGPALKIHECIDASTFSMRHGLSVFERIFFVDNFCVATSVGC